MSEATPEKNSPTHLSDTFSQNLQRVDALPAATGDDLFDVYDNRNDSPDAPVFGAFQFTE